MNRSQNWRRVLRLRNYDYSSPGFYLVTVCIQKRECLLGEIVANVVRLTGAGQVVAAIWQELPSRFPSLTADSFVIMPNHIHGILHLGQADIFRAQQAAPLRPGPSLPAVVRAFKSQSAVSVNRLRQRSAVPVWQRNYYEHVIRGERDLEKIREYISQNPLRWSFDRENPARAPGAETIRPVP